MRATVWFWQLVCLAAWLAVGFLLLRSAATPAARSRAAWVWLLNPVLLGLLLVGAHVDVLAAAFALGAIVLAGRRPLAAGVLLGAAVGVKITFALVGPAVLYALWRNADAAPPGGPRCLGLVGAAVVLVPAQLWAGSNLLDQLERARRYVSLASPWRPIVEQLTGPVANDVVRQWVVTLTPWVVGAVRRRRSPWWCTAGRRGPDRRTGPIHAASPRTPPPPRWCSARPTCSPRPTRCRGTTRSRGRRWRWWPCRCSTPCWSCGWSTYAVAYVPGRVLGSSPQVERLTLGYRREVAPWVGGGLLLALVALALWPRPAPRRPRGPAGSPR